MSAEEQELLVGPYTVEIREHYMAYRKARYLIDHPGKTQAQAQKAARMAWRFKVKRAERQQNAGTEV